MRAAGVLTALFLLLAWAPFEHKARSQAPVELLVIAHRGVADARVDIDSLRALFLRKKQLWNDKQRVIPLNYPAGHPLRVAFDRAVLGFSGEQAARYWIDERIRHGTEAPLSIANEALLPRVVSQLPGSVGYVHGGAVPAGVRVLARVDGDRVVAP